MKCTLTFLVQRKTFPLDLRKKFSSLMTKHAYNDWICRMAITASFPRETKSQQVFSEEYIFIKSDASAVKSEISMFLYANNQ